MSCAKCESKGCFSLKKTHTHRVLLLLVVRFVLSYKVDVFNEMDFLKLQSYIPSVI